MSSVLSYCLSLEDYLVIEHRAKIERKKCRFDLSGNL